MKILYLIPQFEAGGAEKQILLLSKYMIHKQHQIIVASKRGRWTEKLIELNIPNYNIDFKNSFFKIDKLVREISKIIHREKPDIIHPHTFLTALLAKIALKSTSLKIPLVTTVHGWTAFGYCCKSFILNFLTDKLIAVSKYVEKNLISAGASRNKVVLIYNGIDIQDFQINLSNADAKQTLGFSLENLVIGMIARLEPQKNPALFLKAANIVASKRPDVKFILAGAGSLKNKLEYLSEKLSLQDKIKFLDSRDDIPLLLKAMDLFVLTSNRESLGIVILEAMVAGVPVVATAVDGVPELISHSENGWLVSPGDAQSLAESILNLLDDPEKLNQMRESALKKVENFTSEIMAHKTLSLYKELLTFK